MYEYKAKLVKVVDGDTVDVDIDLGFGVWLKNERVRIMGIDTPESRTRDKVEKIFGLAAKARVQELIEKDTILKTFAAKDGEDMKGKFGRILGDFMIGDSRPGVHGQAMLTDILIHEGHAVKYYGQNKADIERGHMSNRNKLMNEGVVNPKDVQEAAG
mgnify:FL=1|tara:strand:+ start:135 stop:608 length:474 start_codon:yes stop_codon:yes gene_type:complete